MAAAAAAAVNGARERLGVTNRVRNRIPGTGPKDDTPRVARNAPVHLLGPPSGRRGFYLYFFSANRFGRGSWAHTEWGDPIRSFGAKTISSGVLSRSSDARGAILQRTLGFEKIREKRAASNVRPPTKFSSNPPRFAQDIN